MYDTLPERVKAIIRAETISGVKKTTAEMLFLLFKVQQPGTLSEIDSVYRRLRTPSVCKNPASALNELRSWFAALQRAVEMKVALPDVKELWRGATSIYEHVFSGCSDPHVTFRWQAFMERTGGAHIQTHATLKSMNEFAMGELNAMVIAGVSSQNPSLPRKQQGDRDAQARATIHADEQSLSPMAAAVNNQMAKGLRTSHTTAPWAEPCRNWDTPSGCRRGISCAYQHRGFAMFTADGTMVTRCLNCGSLSHVVKECRAPGGGQDPNKSKALDEYRARKAQHAPASTKGQKGGKSYGKTSGSGKSQANIEQSGGSNQAAFTGKGKKGKGKERYAHAVTSFAASHGSSSFPKGAAGPDNGLMCT